VRGGAATLPALEQGGPPPEASNKRPVAASSPSAPPRPADTIDKTATSRQGQTRRKAGTQSHGAHWAGRVTEGAVLGGGDEEEKSATSAHRPISQLPLFVAVLAIALLLALPAAAGAAPRLDGVMLHSLWWESSSADMDRELDLARDAGADVVRLDVAWSSLETGGKGSLSPWYVDKLDRFMAGAQARGLRVIATLFSTPCWASSAPDDLRQGCAGAWWDRGVQTYAPKHASDYADVARWLTGRYGSALAALEVWNEPNLERFWIAPDPAASYAALLKAAYPAAKAGNPGVPVLAGALAHADRPFLDRLYAHGIEGFHDGLSFHPYNEWREPGDRWMEKWRKYTFLPGIEWMRDGQRQAGDVTPLWITEFGWSTCTEHQWCVSEQRQADYLAGAVRILDGLEYVESAVVYNLRDKGDDPADLEHRWGLVRRDFSPKPAYGAFKAALGGEARGPVGEPPPASGQVSVGITIRRGTAVAHGRAPARRLVRLRLRRCPAARARSRVARVGRLARAGKRSRYSRRLGPARRLRGCVVVARVQKGRVGRVARARVPKRAGRRPLARGRSGHRPRS
jgi:polysaccharide biosynthesis protein PslG